MLSIWTWKQKNVPANTLQPEMTKTDQSGRVYKEYLFPNGLIQVYEISYVIGLNNYL